MRVAVDKSEAECQHWEQRGQIGVEGASRWVASVAA